MNTVVAGVDVGGTSIKSFLVDSAGHVTDAVHLDTRPGNVVEQACHVARTIVDKWPEVAGIGVITPGVVDEEAGVIKYASNLELKNVNLAQRMQEACLRPVRLGHDGRAAGLAEGLLAHPPSSWFPSAPAFRQPSATVTDRGQVMPSAPEKLATRRSLRMVKHARADSEAARRCTHQQKPSRDASRRRPAKRQQLAR